MIMPLFNFIRAERHVLNKDHSIEQNMINSEEI